MRRWSSACWAIRASRRRERSSIPCLDLIRSAWAARRILTVFRRASAMRRRDSGSASDLVTASYWAWSGWRGGWWGLTRGVEAKTFSALRKAVSAAWGVVGTGRVGWAGAAGLGASTTLGGWGLGVSATGGASIFGVSTLGASIFGVS